MNDAAVGFQCSDCVRQGAKETRSGRAAYGGQRSADPRLTTYVLIGLNALVWLLVAATGGGRSEWINRLALLPTGRCVPTDQPGSYFPAATQADCVAGNERLFGGLDITWIPGVAEGAWWQLFTSMFAHVEPWHLAMNMLALWFLGPQLEAALGRVRFLAVFLGSGLAGSVLVYWLSDAGSSTLGASGCVFGLLAAYLVVGRKVGADLTPILGWVGINVAITVFGRDYISWQGHLGGFIGGAIVTAMIVYAPRERRTLWQVVGLVAFVVACAVAIMLRTAGLS
ncbi:rhomboid family intramembrane serine protease [Nocardioides dubius]|uniref:Rhomboid family intramembrane serine protease n=1 Tax=Nocardioides dubius TaxID=317019 RepID=A0ABP4EQE8_9ACTN